MGGSGGGVFVGAGVMVGIPVGNITGVGGRGWKGVGVTVDSLKPTASVSGPCEATFNCDEEETGTTFNPGIEQAVMLKMVKMRAIRLNKDILQPLEVSCMDS
jgi:hypothetical protein